MGGGLPGTVTVEVHPDSCALDVTKTEIPLHLSH
jgi:hypothetical protein